jgi:hypothetical protein
MSLLAQERKGKKTKRISPGFRNLHFVNGSLGCKSLGQSQSMSMRLFPNLVCHP